MNLSSSKEKCHDASPAGGRRLPGRNRIVLDDIRNWAPLPRNVSPERALMAVACTLDQHITGGESLHLLESLPREVQPLLGPCLLHRNERAEHSGWDEFVERVADELEVTRDEAGEVIPAVMGALSSRLPEETVAHVASQLPDDMKHFWAKRP